MNAYASYIPILAVAIVTFALLTLNPSWLQGKKYGDKHPNQPDPLMTSIVIFLIGALIVWLLESKTITLGGSRYRY